jgi:hypothetical protein
MHCKTITVDDDSVLLQLGGRVEPCDAEQLLTILEGVQQGDRCTILDLARVAYFDGSAIDALLAAEGAETRPFPRPFKVANSTQEFRDLIRTKRSLRAAR